MSPDPVDLAAHPGIRWMTIVETAQGADGSTEASERSEGCRRIWSLAQTRAQELSAPSLTEVQVATSDGTLVLVRDGPSIAAAAIEAGAAGSVVRYELRRALRARNARG